MNNKRHPNLKPWQSGRSGNPTGRKPGSKNMSTIVGELLAQEADGDVLTQSKISELVQGVSMSYAKAVVWVTIQKALKGDMRAITWLAEQQERDSLNVAHQERSRQQPVVTSHIKPRNQSAVE